MSLLKRLGGAPQPNEPAPAAPPPPAPVPENGAARNGGIAVAPPPAEAPRAAPVEQRPQASGGLSSLVGASGSSSGIVTSPDPAGVTDQRVLELSLWIVDRIQGSMGNQTELKRT